MLRSDPTDNTYQLRLYGTSVLDFVTTDMLKAFIKGIEEHETPPDESNKEKA